MVSNINEHSTGNEETARETARYVDMCVAVYRRGNLPLVPLAEEMMHQAVRMMVEVTGEEAALDVLQRYAGQIRVADTVGHA